MTKVELLNKYSEAYRLLKENTFWREKILLHDGRIGYKGFIHKLLNSDLSKEGKTIRDIKLPYINLPLYKYC